MIRRAVLWATWLACCPGTAAAQETDDDAPRPMWTDVAYPKFLYKGREGLILGGYYAYVSPLGFADFDRPEAYRGSLSVSGELTTRGSRELVLEARLPYLVPGWRFVGTLEAERRARERYFGIGNASVYDAANEAAPQPNFYRSRITRYTARGEVQRRLGPLRALAGLQAERWRVDTLEGPSRLALDAAAGVDPFIGRGANDVTGRVGLVWDTRDSESAPRRGGVVEFIVGRADAGVAGDLTYTRATGSASLHIPVGYQLVLAGRVLGQKMWGTPPLGAYYLIEASDRPFLGLGGPESHRGIDQYRLLGRDKLLANVDVRYDLVAVPTLARATLVGFLDAGRVFQSEAFSLTTADLKVGGGIGGFLQFGRVGVLGLTVGLGPDGLISHAHARWTY